MPVGRFLRSKILLNELEGASLAAILENLYDVVGRMRWVAALAYVAWIMWSAKVFRSTKRCTKRSM
uniref:Uncharacterized protein n=1 Tax=Tetraselmis sp. GSL018 TaxID=582737 RepID=A0A061QSJ8_9CHLO